MTEKDMVPRDEGGEVVPYRAPAETLLELMKANLGDASSPADYIPTYRIQRSVWEFAGLKGVEQTNDLSGVVIHWASSRTYWKVAYEDSDGSPPDCYSFDGKKGLGDNGTGEVDEKTGEVVKDGFGYHDCAACPQNQPGSNVHRGEDSRAKACGDRRHLYVLQAGGSPLPVRVVLPPTSLGPWQQYATNLLYNEVGYLDVETGLEIEMVKRGGNTYGVLKPVFQRELEAHEKELVESMRKTFIPALEAREEERFKSGQSYEG